MKSTRLLPLWLLVPALTTTAAAQVPHDVCVHQGFGVPTRNGPPDWWSATASGGNPALDDPRWNQANAQSFPKGSATAPLHTRTLWGNVGAQEFLYMSFIVDVAPNDSIARDLFVGFHRAQPDMTRSEYGYVLHVHIAGGATAQSQAITYCADYGTCSDNTNWWRMFYEADPAATATCDVVTGHQFSPMNSANSTTPPASVAWIGNTLRIWRNATATPPDAGRWAVQLQVPLVAAGQPISAGIEKGATYWYEATEANMTSNYFPLGNWPVPSASKTGVTNSICVNKNLGNWLVHQDLGDVQKWSKLTAGAGGAPTDCDTGLQIGFIGVVDGTTKTTKIRSDQANHMTVEVVNPSATAGGTNVTMPNGTVHARFRLANWGTQVWNIPGDIGVWNDVPGGNDVCLGPSGCTSTNVSINAGTTQPIQFDWNLTDVETCQYQVGRTGVSCVSSTCADPLRQVSVNGAACIAMHNQHQCMYVELSAPNSDVGFTQASAYNNMDFATMSEVAREALIDARHLPKAPGQMFQDIYFFVQPRNMPASLPAGATVTGMIKDSATARALSIAEPYIADMQKLFDAKDENGLKAAIESAERDRPVNKKALQIATHPTDTQLKILKSMQIMARDDFERVTDLMSVAFSNDDKNETLVLNTVATLGPAEAAQIVPTLEVYPFYLPADKGHRYQPMTSFTVFLSHEGTLGGMRYEIDGAREEEQNVYHLRIPVDFARRIQVRAAALPETVKNGNPNWPCTGCACGKQSCGLVGGTASMLPGIFAFGFAMRRRRRRRSLIAPLF